MGAGGKGASDVSGIADAGGTYVAFAMSIDRGQRKTLKAYPNAKVYSDFREMLDKEKGIDAVSVSTPDHVHAIAALSAMALGKHVYVQKPLTYSIHEARLMEKAARTLWCEDTNGKSSSCRRAHSPRGRIDSGGDHRSRS